MNAKSLHECSYIKAYTIYAFFEWALILLDVGFDAVTAIEFEGLELIVRDVQESSRGYVYWLPKYANVGRLLCFSNDCA